MSFFLPPSIINPVDQGVNIQFEDWNAFISFIITISGYAIAFGQGNSSGNGNPQIQPLAVATPGGLSVAIGGTSSDPQWAMIAGILAASITLQPFAVPVNSSGYTRTDMIAVQSQMQQASTVSREVEAQDGTKSQQDIPYNFSGIVFQYVAGPTGSDAGPPTVPTGWQSFALITVANNATNITSDDVAIQFPTMNPTGPQGPAGHGSTVTSGSGYITLPEIGGSVTFTVEDATAFPVNTNGVVFGNGDVNAMYFTVTAVTDNSLTVTNTGAVPGWGQGEMHYGGPVTFGSPPSVVNSIAPFSHPVVNYTADISVSSYGSFGTGSYGLCVGPNGGHAFMFKVDSLNLSTGVITVLNVATLIGNPGNPIGAEANLLPIPQPVLFYQDGSSLVGGVIKICGVASDPGIGGNVLVSFSGGFASANSYRITGLVPFGKFAPYVTNKTSTGFLINIPSDADGHGNIEWSVQGGATY